MLLEGTFFEARYEWSYDSNHGNNTRVIVWHNGLAVAWFDKDYWDNIQAGRAPVELRVDEAKRDITAMIRAIPERGQ